ncbi:ABC transporter permease subunit [Cohnella hashimotonis]|uniref:ABC transporter permease subunit n=1 Tax=Cohnella hashimotonis TaxID=2826895 RepID=A0ABT6TNH0_9BACL|nr:PQQ-binding-like beta-propeller repeat protein [Cohnella hashimotonis]MDI4647469.1 ABC transporter permease subunit [Cohnella hashimotonis]
MKKLAIIIVALLFLYAQPAFAEALWKMDKELTINSISVSEDGERMAVGTQDAVAVVLDRNGKPLFEAQANNVVTDVALLNDGRLLVASDDRNVYMVDGQGNNVWTHTFNKMVKSLVATGDGQLVAITLYRSDAVYLLDLQGEVVREIPIGIYMDHIGLSPSGSWIVVGAADQYVYLLNSEGETVTKTPMAGAIKAVSVADDGTMAVGTSDYKLSVFDRDGQPIGSRIMKDQLTSVHLDAAGAYVAAADFAGNYAILKTNGSLLWSAKEPGAGQQVKFSGDGRRLYAASDKGQVYAYEIDGLLASAKAQAARDQAWKIGLIAAGAIALTGAVYMLQRRKPQVLARLWKDKFSYLMLVPSLSLLCVFMYTPAFSGLFHSLYDWNPVARSEFVGLDNFKRIFADPYVGKGAYNLLILIATGLVKAIVPPLIVAELIYHLRNKKAQYWFRTSFVLSMVVPTVGILLIWQNLYDPGNGMINQLLEALGLGSWSRPWLGEAKTALWALIFINFPFVGILQLLVLYSGLIGISEEVIEAAKMDGARTPRIIRSIHLPLLAGQIKLLVVLAVIAIVQDFGTILIMTGGGPMDSTYVPALQMYFAATKFNDLGYASALGVTMFAAIFILTIVNMKFIKTEAD